MSRMDYGAIERAVCAEFRISPDDMRGPSRIRRVAYARMVLMRLARDKCRLSYPALGARMGGRDHTTVLSGLRRVSTLPHLWARLEKIEATLPTKNFRERFREQLDAVCAICGFLQAVGDGLVCEQISDATPSGLIVSIDSGFDAPCRVDPLAA